MDDLTTTAVGAAAATDLTNCDREPIHVPGSIQPHGVLLAFVEPALTIVSASANAAALLGTDGDPLIGRALDTILDAADVEEIRRHRSEGLAGLDALPVATTGRDGPRRWTALVHRHEGLSVVELEPVSAPAPGTSTLLLLSAAAQRLQASVDPVDACTIVADEVRRITGFARVKVYRFAADWSGDVLGESRDADMPSYLGLHFPASDIPVQAREMYRSNPVRLIGDVRYVPVPLVPDRNPSTGGPIDLRYATLRSVSPIHLEYLRNMDVGASMSASILRNGALWGLIACHHRAPLPVDFERRQACALLARLLSARLDAHERNDRTRRSVHVEGLRADLLEALADGQTVTEAIDQHRDAWMRLVDATGFAIARADQLSQAGNVPDATWLRGLVDWLGASGRATPDGAVALDRLGAVHPAAIPVAEVASGVLAVPLSRTENGWLLWFRPELPQTVTWAGRPAKTEAPLATGTVLHPRLSFDAWTETVRGRSSPWTDQDVAAALQLREMLLDLSMREKDELERRNIRLVLGARELETFIYVASHDIKEPLRQMEMLASLLDEHVRPDSRGEADDYFREFRTVATRLRTLTDSLADYAKLGRTRPAPVPTALDDVLEEVELALRAPLAEAGAELVVQRPLPTVLAERAQLHQVFVNLIGNALKYRATDRRPRIVVRADEIPSAEEPIGRARPMTRLSIVDNGIGFDPKHAEQVFEAFWRAHSRDRYPGSGIGLAICRRIVERHGGRIGATSASGVGSTFWLTLPLASASPRASSLDRSP